MATSFNFLCRGISVLSMYSTMHNEIWYCCSSDWVDNLQQRNPHIVGTICYPQCKSLPAYFPLLLTNLFHLHQREVERILLWLRNIYFSDTHSIILCSQSVTLSGTWRTGSKFWFCTTFQQVLHDYFAAGSRKTWVMQFILWLESSHSSR